MKPIEKRILTSIDGMKEEITEFLADLVKAKSVNPPGDTREAANVITKKFMELAIEHEVVSKDDDKPNLIAKINPGKKPELLLNSHLDTVPPGDLGNWKYDPFEAMIEEGKMYGRGTADAKCNIVAMVMASKAILESRVKLRGSLVVNPVSEEEVGGFGAKYVFDKGYVKPDFVIIGEQTDNHIAIAEKGVIWFNIKIFGRTAHASLSWEGVNAIEKMITLLNRIQEKVVSKIKTQRHPLTPPPSMNIGMIRGGVKTNVVPDVCEVSVDRRFLPDERPEKVIKQITDIIDGLKAGDPDFKADLEIPVIGSPINTSPDAEIVKIAQGVCKDLNLSSELIGYAQASDGRFFAEKGIQTIIIGPTDPKLGHAPNEYVTLNDVVTATKIHAMIALRVLT